MNDAYILRENIPSREDQMLRLFWENRVQQIQGIARRPLWLLHKEVVDMTGG